MNAIQMEELYEAIDKVIVKKENPFIIFFGANKISELGIRYLKTKGITVSAIIDNSKEKAGTEKCGVKVFMPEEMLSEYKENAVIFIASHYVKPMTEQLERMGYEKNRHIFETIYHIPTLQMEEFKSTADKVRDGYEVYKNLIQNVNGTMILCPYKGIGDIYFISTYLEEYCKKERIEEYTLMVVGDACKRVADMFDMKSVMTITQREMDRLLKYISFVGISRFDLRILNHNFIHYNIMSPFEEKGKISWGKMFLCGIMEFSSESLPTGKKLKVRHTDVLEYEGLKKGQTVILAPYANTVSNAEIELWEELAIELKKQGYTVCTNSIGKEEPVIEDTIPLEVSLENMPGIVEYAGIFIGVRSGVCDLISGTEAKKIILYPDKSSLFFNMADMGIANNVIEISLYGQNNVLEHLLEIVKNEFLEKE